mmetsp:Transcript_26814/g.70448  ORF Transcript_26814/g.70448 Transcript_26814/m.70448 type:complete len:229 (-) Transcript_26814:1743-2429(-)
MTSINVAAAGRLSSSLTVAWRLFWGRLKNPSSSDGVILPSLSSSARRDTKSPSCTSRCTRGPHSASSHDSASWTLSAGAEASPLKWLCHMAVARWPSSSGGTSSPSHTARVSVKGPSGPGSAVRRGSWMRRFLRALSRLVLAVTSPGEILRSSSASCSLSLYMLMASFESGHLLPMSTRRAQRLVMMPVSLPVIWPAASAAASSCSLRKALRTAGVDSRRCAIWRASW